MCSEARISRSIPLHRTAVVIARKVLQGIHDLVQCLGVAVSLLFDIIIVIMPLNIKVFLNPPLPREIHHPNLLPLIQKQRPRQCSQQDRQHLAADYPVLGVVGAEARDAARAVVVLEKGGRLGVGAVGDVLHLRLRGLELRERPGARNGAVFLVEVPA